MPYLIGEMSDGIVVAVEVNTAVFKSFNKMAKNAGRMGTKYDFIGEIFTSIKAGGGGS